MKQAAPPLVRQIDPLVGVRPARRTEAAGQPSHVYSWTAVDVDADERRWAVERVATLLRGVDFLAALSQDDRERLAAQARVAPFPDGVVVVGRASRATASTASSPGG